MTRLQSPSSPALSPGMSQTVQPFAPEPVDPQVQSIYEQLKAQQDQMLTPPPQIPTDVTDVQGIFQALKASPNPAETASQIMGSNLGQWSAENHTQAFGQWLDNRAEQDAQVLRSAELQDWDKGKSGADKTWSKVFTRANDETKNLFPGVDIKDTPYQKLVDMHKRAQSIVKFWKDNQRMGGNEQEIVDAGETYQDPNDRAVFLNILSNSTRKIIGNQATGGLPEFFQNIVLGSSKIAEGLTRFGGATIPFIPDREHKVQANDWLATAKKTIQSAMFEPPADRSWWEAGLLETGKQLPAMVTSMAAGIGGAGKAAAGGLLSKTPAAAETAGAVSKFFLLDKARQAGQAVSMLYKEGGGVWKGLGNVATKVGEAAYPTIQQTAFWTTQIAPDLEQDLKESGLDASVARPAAILTAAVEGVIENLNARQLLGPEMERLGVGGIMRYALSTLDQTGKEISEEFLQAATETVGKRLATLTSDKAKFSWADEWKSIEEQMKQVVVPVAIMQAPGSIITGAQHFQAGQERYGEMLRADVLRQMDPATRKALKEGNEEVRRQHDARQSGENIYPMSEGDVAKLYDYAHAEAPAGMREALAGRAPGERVGAYQDRMKAIADQYDVGNKDTRVGSVKRYYESISQALQDFMRGQTAQWAQNAPLSPEDEEYVPLPTFQPKDVAPSEPDDYGWQPIQKDPAVEHGKIRAAMQQVRQTETGKLMNRKQAHAEAMKLVAEGDAIEQQAAAEMYQDPRAAALFYLFGVEDRENAGQSRPDAGRHLVVANRPDHAKTFEEHGLPGLNGVRNARVIRSKFVNAIRQFSELPRGLIKEIARLATSDTEALTEEPGGNVKIDRTWRKYPDGSNAPGMVFHDTPFGRFGRREIPGDPELTPFTYEEAGNWVASLQNSQNAPELIQAQQAPTVDQVSEPQGEATPVAQATAQPVSTPAPEPEGPQVSPDLQKQIDEAAQAGDFDRLSELMGQVQDQGGMAPPAAPPAPPAPPVTPSVTAPPVKPTGAPPVKPAPKKPDRISELEAQVKDLGKRTKAASDAGDTETAQRLAAEAGRLIDEIGSLEKAKPKDVPETDFGKKPEAPKPKSAIDELGDLMQSPRDWRDAATQIASGATSLANEVTLPDLYAALSARFPGLTHEEFRQGMLELADQKKLVLGDYTRAPADVANNPAAIMVPKGKDSIYDQWKFYVRSAPPKVTAKNPKPAPVPRKKTAEEVIYDSLPKPVQAVVDDLRKHSRDKGHAGFTLAEEPDAGWTILAMDLAERLSGKTGKSRTMPVVWFRGEIANGMHYKGVVFLNADLPRPDNLWGVIAHEVSHLLGIDESLKFDDPDLMDQLRDEYYWHSPPAQRSILKSNDKLWNREAVAYLIDRLFHNPDFRLKMQQEKPTVWQKIVAAFRRFFDRFRGSKKWDPKDPANSLAQRHLDKIQEVFMGSVPDKVRSLSSVPEVTPSKFHELDEIMFSPMKDVAQYLRDRFKSTSNEEKFFARYMQDALRALQVQVSARTRKGNISKAGIRKAVDKYMEDVSEYLSANPSKAEYYANEAHRERAELVKVFPELEHDEVWSAYQMLNGMASAQTNLGENTQETIDAWSLLREKGEIPTKKVMGEDGKMKLAGDGFVVHGGPSSRNKINNYRAFNKLLKKHGSVGEVAAFLTGSVSREGLLQLRRELGWATIGEIGDILNTVQHATGQTESIPRMFIFGPKVGAYSLNRMGDYRYQTIDVWESRLARFYLSDIRFTPGQTGLLEGDDRRIAQEFGKLVAEELGLDAAAAQAVRWYHFKGFVKELGYGKVKDEDLKTISEITAGRLAEREGDGSGGSQAATGRTHAVIRGSGRGIEARRRATAEKIRDNLTGEYASDELMLSPKTTETPAERVEKQKAFNKVVAKYVLEQKRYAMYRNLIKDLIDSKGQAKVMQYEQYLKVAWNTARAMLPQMQLQAAEDVGSMFPSSIKMIGEPASDLSKIYAQAAGTDRLFIAMDDDNEQIATLSPAAIKTIQKAIADGGSVHIDLGSWGNFADSQGKGWNRVLEGVGKLLVGMDRGKAGRINIILPDVFGNQTESHQLQKVVAGRLRPLADSGVTFVVPIQKGDASIADYVGWTLDLGMPPSSLVLGIPIGGRQWSQENVIEYAANEADNAVMPTQIHLMGVTNRDAGSIAAYINGVNPKAVVTGENSARHRGDESDHLEGIGKAFSKEMRKARLKLQKEGDQWILTDTKEGDYKDHQGTYNNQNWIKNIGGVWDQSRRGYKFSKDPRQDIYNNLTRRKRELEEKKRQEEARADRSVLSKPATEIVSKETQDAINAGRKAGVNAETLEGQIEDIARISEAITENRGAFILASGTGTGKTFVLGGVVREAMKGFPKVIWVTKNKELVAQAKRDTKVFGIEEDAIEFMTYAALSTSGAADSQGALLIFDESHEINNFVPDEKGVDRRQTRSERAVVAQGMIKAARFTIFSSATPMRNPVDAGYIASTGIFDRVGGFVEWAQIYGADVAKTSDGTLTVHWARGGRESLNRTTEARHWLLRQGIFSKQKVHLPTTPDGKPLVHTMFKTVKLDQERLKRYNDVMAAYQKAMADNSHLIAQIKRHSENVYKRLTEFLKAPEAIKEAQRIIEAGGQVVVFTDYKSDSWIGRYQYSERYRAEHGIKDKDSEMFPAAVVVSRMEQWKKEAAIAKSMGDAPPTQPFADEIYAIAKACAEMKLEFKMDSTLDLFAQAFNKDEIGFFTGPIKTDYVNVTAKSRESDKEKWLRNKKNILVATIGSGGTGLSLHDTTGKMPTRMQLGIALPWTGVQTEQAAGRLARQGIQKETGIVWMFAEGITFEKSLAARVGARLNDMGGLLSGIENPQGSALEDFDFEGNFDPLTGGVARELQIEVGANTQEDSYGFVQGEKGEEGGTEEGEESSPEEGSEGPEGDVEYAEGVDEGVTEKDGFKVGDLVEYADPGDPSSAWVGSVTAFKGDSAWVATEDEEFLIPLSWMEHLEQAPRVDDIPVDKPTPPPAPKTDKQAGLFDTERPATSRVFSIDPQKVQVKPGMQFKKNADKEGVTEGDKIGEQESWDETMAGTFLFWQANDGTVYVADGHHRLAHAKRTGAELIHGYLLREQDGYTFPAARAHAALINIKNDKGTVYDHAAFFRDSQITEEEASNRGLLRKVMGRTGFMVGRFATDSVYEAFLNEDITPEKAAVIAEVGKDNPAIQAVGLKWARTKRQTAEVLRESLRIFRDSRAASEGVLKKDKLKQLSIFEDYVPTDDELEAEREADAVASAVVKAKAELRETIRRHKALLANPEAARKQDVSFNEQTSKDLVEKSLIDLDEWEHVGTNPELYERARLMAGLPPKATDGLGQEVANSYGGSGGRRRGSGYKGSGAAPANQPSTSFPFTPGQVQNPIPIGFLYDLALAIMGSAPEIKRLRGALGMAIHKEMLGVEHMRILIDPSAAIDVDMLRKVLAHEIGHIDDVIDPNSPALNTIKRGNLVGRIFKLRKFLQGQFQNLKNNDLKKELIALTEWWSGPIAGGSASYQRYRRSARELYAEFLSVFLVSPGEAQARAPEFYAAFTRALDLHKPFKQELLAIQATLAGSPDAEADRMGRVMSEMWGEGQDAFLAHRKAIAESIYRPAAHIVTSFMAILLDKNAHAQSMAKHAVKQGVITEYERREFLATIDDLHHINSPGLAALGRFMQNVTWELEKANLPRSAFDDYMFQQRVMGDPGRQDKANPKAADAQAAAKSLAKMERDLGPVKWAKLVQIGRNASDMMFSAFEEGYKEGLFTDEMMNQAKLNRYTYMPFVILQYWNGWVHPGVKEQQGTFLSTAPASEAITKKIMSLHRAITLNRAKRKTMDLAQKSFKYHASRLQVDNLGNLLSGQKIKTDLNDVLWVWEDGKEVPYEVDKFIVEMFKTHEIKSLEAVTNAISNVIYSVWHPLFVTFSPKFMYRNFFRDPMRSAIGIPAYVAGIRKDRMEYLMAGGMSKAQAQAATKDMKVGSLELLFKYYGPAFVKTWAAKKKKDAAFFAYYLEKGVFSEQIFTEPAHRVDLTDKTSELDKMYQEAGYQDVPDSARAAWKQKIAPITRPVKYTAAPWLLRNIGRLNQVFELTSKVASTDAMVDAGLPDWAVKVGARKHAGTPDIMQRGSMTGPANSLSMYFKVKFVGLASDASLAFTPSTAFAWWWRTAIMGIAPVIANAIARMFWPGYKDAEDKIGDYLRKNYLCLFWPGVETSDGKQAVVTIPMDETTRFVHAVTTNLFDVMRGGDDSRKSTLWKMFKNDWGAMVDQVLPSYNPAITIMGGWKDFLADDQPMDKFYKRPIINDRDWALRDEQPWDGVAKMASWTMRQMGVLDIAYQAVGAPFSESYYGAEEKPWYSSAWKITGLDALVRATDQGLDEIEHIETQQSELEGHRFRAKLTPKARSLSQEYEVLRNKKPDELTGEEKKRKESLRGWMNGTYTPIRQAIQNAKEIGMTDAEVKDLYAKLNDSAGDLTILNVDLSRGLREKTRIAQLNDDLSEPATIRDIGSKAASLLETKMYLTKNEGDEARRLGITPEEMFRRIQAQMYSDRKVTKAWLKTRGITPQQAIEAYQVYAHERAANTRRKDGTPGRVDPTSLRKSVNRLAVELQSQ